MDAFLRKALVQEFERALRPILPTATHHTSAAIPQGWRCYRVPLGEALFGFVILTVKSDENRFTLGIAVSRSTVPPPSLYGGPNDPLEGAGLYFRIHKLWAKDGREHWWWLGPEPKSEDRMSPNPPLPASSDESSIAVVVPAVSRAIEAIVNDVVPYFQKMSALEK